MRKGPTFFGPSTIIHKAKCTLYFVQRTSFYARESIFVTNLEDFFVIKIGMTNVNEVFEPAPMKGAAKKRKSI